MDARFKMQEEIGNVPDFFIRMNILYVKNVYQSRKI